MSGQEVQGMLIRLEATTAQLRQEMAKADSTVTQVSGRIDSQLGRVDSAFDRVGQSAQAAGNMVRNALAGAVSVAGISELLKHAEAYTTVANRLKLVTTNAAEFTAAQNAVFNIAQRSGQPLEATAELYQRIAQNQKELKLTGQGVAGIVETISKTMVISGASTESANAALIQLGQAFASGTLRGEELNSVLEQAPALAQAIAKGMGVSVGALRALGSTGKLTADAVVKALQAQAGAVDQLFGKMQITVSQGMTKLDNSATNLIGKLDQTSGVSQKLSGVLTDMSKVLDSVANDSATLSDTVQRVTNVVETLAVVIGARLAISVGQSAVAFVSATKASIEQTAALVRATAAADTALTTDAATAKQSLLTAQSRQVDAKALLERANVELATAEQKVAADRMRQASELGNLQSVQAALVAERGLEEQRLKAQISAAGRAQSVARLAELRLSEVAIIDQVKAAEVSLAETTVATSAQIQAAYKARAAAAGAYGETTLVANSAAAVSERTAAAASVASRSVGVLSAAGGGLLSLMTGPVGLIATAGLVALSFVNFGSSAEKASKALIDHGLTIDQTTQKYRDLSAEQQRFQSATWVKEQKEALNAAATDLGDYSTRVMTSLNAINNGSTEYQQQFVKMIAEVKSGTRSLDSVTAWAKETVKLAPIQVARLTEIASAYSQSTKDAADFGAKLSTVDAATKSAASSSDKLSTAQQNSGMTDANRVAWDKYIEQLTKTRDLLGANAEAEAAYEAAKMGASPAQMAAAKLIGEQTDTLKKYQEAIKQSNEIEKASLKIKLTALYAAEDAQNAAAAAQKKTMEDAAKAAEDSATRQVNAMQQVINQTLRVVNGQNLLLVQPQKQNLTGYGLLTNGGTAPAPVIPKATPDQRAEAAIAQLDATTEANKRVDKAANAAAAALKAQAKALQELLDKSGISTKSANDMADAYLGGADNVRAMTIQQKIEEELLKTGAGARDKVTKAINDMQDAEDRRDVAKAAAAMQVEVDQTLAQAKATLQGAAALETFNVNKSMQVELAGKNIAYGSKEYDQLLKQTKAQLEANKALEAANKANDLVDRLNPQVKLLREYTEDQKALNEAISLYPEKTDLYRQSLVKLGLEYEQNKASATVWGQFTQGAVDRVDDAFADAWKNIDKGFKGFSQSLIDGFKQLLAEMAHLAITKPIVMQIGAALGVGGLAASNAASAGSGGFSVGSVLNGASTAYSAITGWGKAVYTGYQSGGLSGAASGFGDYAGGIFSGADQAAGQAVGTLANGSGMTYAPLSYQASNGGLNSVGQSVGQYAPWASALAGAIMGYQNSGAKGAAAGAAGGYLGAKGGAAVGSYFGPIGTAVGAVIGGLLGSIGGSKLFGGDWVTKDQGLQLGVTGGDLDANSFEFQKKKGGLFSSNKKRTKLGELDTETSTELDAAYDKTEKGVLDLVSKIGIDLPQSIFDGLSIAAQQISTKGKTPEEIQTAISAAFGSMADQMIQWIDMGTQGFGYSFEELAQRVANFQSFNAALGVINVQMLKLSPTSMELANSLITASGGMDAFTSSLNAYYGAFFTDTEKASDSLAAVQKQFKDMNVALPETRDGYRAMVEGIDLTTEAGQKLFLQLTSSAAAAASAYDILEARQNTYYGAFYSESENTARSVAAITDEFKKANVALPETRASYRAIVEGIDQTTESGKKLYAALMALSGDADVFYKAQEQVSTAAQATAVNAVSNAMSALQRAVSAQKTALTNAYNAQMSSLNDMAATAQASVSGLTSVGTALENALKSLNGTSDVTVKMLRAQAQATLQAALAQAQSGGSLAGFAGLDDALSTVSTNTTDLYGSLEDFNREQGRTANVVAQLNAINGVQLTTEQQLLKSVQTQIADAKDQFDLQMSALDDQLEVAQKQLDALNGVDNSVLSVAAALAAFNASVQAAIAASAAASKPAAAAGGTYTGGTGTAGAPSYNDINAIYNSVLGRDADASGAVYWGGQAGSMSAAQLAAAIKADAQANGELPKYATGGLISGPGTGTSDSILSRLSNGEYVMNAAAVRMFGSGMLDQMNAGRMPAFSPGAGAGLAGPQLDVTRPSQVYRAGDSMSNQPSVSDAATAAELSALREEVRTGLAEIALHARKTSENTGQLAEVGTQVIGTAQVKVVA